MRQYGRKVEEEEEEEAVYPVAAFHSFFNLGGHLENGGIVIITSALWQD